MKKTNFFITSILIFTGFMMPIYAYNDTENHWAGEVIEKMSSYKIVNGYEDETYKPDDFMTRAEFVTVINRILSLEDESNKYIPDINRSNWYYSEIRKAVYAGIITGNEKGYVLPNNDITREEAIVILTRAFMLKQTNNIKDKFIDSNEISEWAKSEVLSAVSNGYITGYEDNTIRPKNFITRAEVLTLINRVFPQILTINVYEGLIEGDTLLFDDNIVLNNLTMDGNVLISSKALRTLKVKDVTIKGNLILKDKNSECVSNLKVLGNIYEYSKENISSEMYVNEEYGISFAMPKAGRVVLNEDAKIEDYNEFNVVILDIIKDDSLYLKGINTIAREECNKYDYLYREIESGVIGKENKYILCAERNGRQILVIKRENVVYILKFNNIEIDNFVDNIITTMNLFETETVKDTPNRIYKNSKLSLKFVYKENYIVVDDSYNTNVINEEQGFFKLFIQVNTITDIHKYTIEQLKILLSTIASKEGNIEKIETLEIMGNNAIKFKVNDEGRITHSLYVVIGNNLYNIIFKGDEADMNEIGEEMFDDIVKSLEF